MEGRVDGRDGRKSIRRKEKTRDWFFFSSTFFFVRSVIYIIKVFFFTFPFTLFSCIVNDGD